MIDLFNKPRMLYFLQKYITKRSQVGTLSILDNWKVHKKSLEKYNATKNVFEIGAGKNLAQNFFLSEIIKKQLVIDINPMIDLEIVNNVRFQISKFVELKSQTEINSIEDLTSYGIIYRAPYDAAKTDLKDKTLDACISTATLEHIPKEDIISIFDELYRTLKDDGIVSAIIDYSDHYAHTDKSISLLNYLKFDEKSWEKYNHNCHYQNRLRHYDYLEIFNSCGFVLMEEELVFGENNIPTEIIEAYKDKDKKWKATRAHLVLKKAS